MQRSSLYRAFVYYSLGRQRGRPRLTETIQVWSKHLAAALRQAWACGRCPYRPIRCPL